MPQKKLLDGWWRPAEGDTFVIVTSKTKENIEGGKISYDFPFGPIEPFLLNRDKPVLHILYLENEQEYVFCGLVQSLDYFGSRQVGMGVQLCGNVGTFYRAVYVAVFAVREAINDFVLSFEGMDFDVSKSVISR